MTVAIIGAGLAGLACANELNAAGVDVTVYEASDGVGGRVRSDIVDGFHFGSRISSGVDRVSRDAPTA